MRAAKTVNLALEPERRGKADCDAYITEGVDEQRGSRAAVLILYGLKFGVNARARKTAPGEG
jgi:hypothetical protein